MQLEMVYNKHDGKMRYAILHNGFQSVFISDYRTADKIEKIFSEMRRTYNYVTSLDNHWVILVNVSC